MSRLAAIEKALFYSTSEDVVGRIAFALGDTPRYSYHKPVIFDPCAGEGIAGVLAEKLGDGILSYGVELHKGRARLAKMRMTKVLYGSCHQLSAPLHFCNILFLNPPYDFDAGGVRQEALFLENATKWLARMGYLVFIVPRSTLNNTRVKKFLEQNYCSFSVFAYPEPERQRFDQVVLFARRSSSYRDELIIPTTLPVVGSERYKPVADYGFAYTQAIEKTNFGLRGTAPEDYAPDHENGRSVFRTMRWKALMGHGEIRGRGKNARLALGGVDIVPLMKLRPGHRALLLAAGALNGTELPGGILVKGASGKVASTSIDPETGAKITTEHVESMIATLNLTTGEYTYFKPSEAPEEEVRTWFERNGDALAAAMEAAYPPAFDGDITQMDWTDIRAPGVLPRRSDSSLLDAQKLRVAALAHHWKRNKSAILAGKWGTGKTAMSVALTTLHFKHRQRPKVIVTCAAHIVPKWLRDVQGMGHTSMTAKTLSDVDAFFAGDCRFLILSKETAKLGARWEPVAPERRQIVAADVGQDYLPELKYKLRRRMDESLASPVYTCSSCRQEIFDAEGLSVDAEWLGRAKRRCSSFVLDGKGERRVCNAPLWTATKISERTEQAVRAEAAIASSELQTEIEKLRAFGRQCGTTVATNRWPLATYIARRYGGNQRYVYIADEAHVASSIDSDQSQAIHDLAVASERFLFMTATLSGGKASTLFYIMYKVDADFRRIYKFDECQAFVKHNGLLETIEHKQAEDETAALGGKRKGKKKTTRELPGTTPSMLKLLLNYTVFIDLGDLGYQLPPFHEEARVLQLESVIAKAAARLTQDIEQVFAKHKSLLGAYMMAGLGYPDCPSHAEKIVVLEEGVERVIAEAPSIPDPPRGWKKDAELVRIAKARVKKGGKVMVGFTQTKKRSPMPRAKAALEAAGLRVVVLENVPPKRREAWIEERLNDFDVLFTNDRLLETGVDLLWARTIVQYSTELSAYTLLQFSRRAHRLGQTGECEMIHLAYEGTLQEPAMRLMAAKVRAASTLDGDEIAGLGRHEYTGDGIFVELAREVILRRQARGAT